MEKTQKKWCISIGPFGASPIDISHRVDLEILLKEALGEEFSYQPFWEIPNTDMTSDLFKAIVEADLVIADLRGLNPNVMYELGIRHAFNKPTIHLRDVHTKLPWDIDKNYTVTYPLPIQLSHKEELIKEVQERVRKVLSLDQKTKPSYSTLHSVIKANAAIDNLPSVSSDLKEVLSNISKQVRDLNSKVDEMKPVAPLRSSDMTSLRWKDTSLGTNVDPFNVRTIGNLLGNTPVDTLPDFNSYYDPNRIIQSLRTPQSE